MKTSPYAVSRRRVAPLPEDRLVDLPLQRHSSRIMQITDRRDGTLTILLLDGRLDHAGAQVFQQKALQLIADGARFLVVDFGGTSFVASMGIRALLVPTQEVSKLGGQLVLIGLNADLLRLFEVSGMNQMFKVYESLEAFKATLPSTN